MTSWTALNQRDQIGNFWKLMTPKLSLWSCQKVWWLSDGFDYIENITLWRKNFCGYFLASNYMSYNNWNNTKLITSIALVIVGRGGRTLLKAKCQIS